MIVVYSRIFFFHLFLTRFLFSASQKTLKLQTAAKKPNNCPKAPMKLNTGAFVVAPVSDGFDLS